MRYIFGQNMYLLTIKVIFAISIFLLTIITGFLPLKIVKRDTHLFSWCDAFASGVFLSTALLHLLPDAAKKFSTLYSNDYPFAYLICIITCILLVIIERGIFIYSDKHLASNKTIVPIFLVLLLSVHSLVEGAAIGANTNLVEAATIFFAVFAHKGSESFALTVNLHRLEVSTKNIRQIISSFAFVTPLGIFIASYILYATATTSGHLITAYFDAIAAGTFLYLGTEHLIESKKSFEKISEVLALICGVALMALVAAWV